MVVKKKMEARKKQILTVAAKVFAEKGFQETTISEIAQKAKISEASIYEYFTTKEGLLFSIPAESAKEIFDLMEFHLKLIRGSANKLRSIVYLLMQSYQTHTEFASIIMLILKHNKRFLETEGHLVIRQGIKNINKVIEEGIASGEFRKDLNPYLVRAIIIGTIEHLVTNWIMTGRPENLEEFVDPMIDCVIEGIINRPGEPVHWSMKKIPPEIKNDDAAKINV
ncbi:MAG: TetR/AcrR family transcriptional regulator [Desulfosalsimonadaceae bacterium]